jgi:hypothetical protein
MCIALHIKRPLFLSYFNKPWGFSIYFRIFDKFLWKSAQWEPNRSMQTDVQMDTHTHMTMLIAPFRKSVNARINTHCGNTCKCNSPWICVWLNNYSTQAYVTMFNHRRKFCGSRGAKAPLVFFYLIIIYFGYWVEAEQIKKFGWEWGRVVHVHHRTDSNKSSLFRCKMTKKCVKKLVGFINAFQIYPNMFRQVAAIFRGS